VSVSKDGGDPVVVANLGPGQVVGEISLLHDQPANATVLAHSVVGALFLNRNDFQDLLQKHPDVHAYLTTLSADRLKATQAAHEADEVLDADEFIVL
ncbi:MAG: cyclic nucleotide-binding domain-containing protein, partial [Clostridia bacterium]|nr:cyclic nucleotide-binding domain-containing protein [Deltaproteobacteria bacterium]